VRIFTLDLTGAEVRLLLEPPTGDVNGDWRITPHDAALVMRHILGLTALTPEQQTRGDVTSDGKLSALDAARILQYTTGIIDIENKPRGLRRE